MSSPNVGSPIYPVALWRLSCLCALLIYKLPLYRLSVSQGLPTCRLSRYTALPIKGSPYHPNTDSPCKGYPTIQPLSINNLPYTRSRYDALPTNAPPINTPPCMRSPYIGSPISIALLIYGLSHNNRSPYILVVPICRLSLPVQAPYMGSPYQTLPT